MGRTSNRSPVKARTMHSERPSVSSQPPAKLKATFSDSPSAKVEASIQEYAQKLNADSASPARTRPPRMKMFEHVDRKAKKDTLQHGAPLSRNSATLPSHAASPRIPKFGEWAADSTKLTERYSSQFRVAALHRHSTLGFFEQDELREAMERFTGQLELEAGCSKEDAIAEAERIQEGILFERYGLNWMQPQGTLEEHLSALDLNALLNRAPSSSSMVSRGLHPETPRGHTVGATPASERPSWRHTPAESKQDQLRRFRGIRQEERVAKGLDWAGDAHGYAMDMQPAEKPQPLGRQGILSHGMGGPLSPPAISTARDKNLYFQGGCYDDDVESDNPSGSFDVPAMVDAIMNSPPSWASPRGWEGTNKHVPAVSQPEMDTWDLEALIDSGKLERGWPEDDTSSVSSASCAAQQCRCCREPQAVMRSRSRGGPKTPQDTPQRRTNKTRGEPERTAHRPRCSHGPSPVQAWNSGITRTGAEWDVNARGYSSDDDNALQQGCRQNVHEAQRALNKKASQGRGVLENRSPQRLKQPAVQGRCGGKGASGPRAAGSRSARTPPRVHPVKASARKPQAAPVPEDRQGAKSPLRARFLSYFSLR